MAEQIKIELSEEALAIVRSFQTLPDTMLGAIARAMDLENQFTVSHIQAEYLSFSKGGPPVEIGLRVQSNRLRGSVRASKAVVSGQAVESAIGSNVEYAAIHEFGGTIPAHTVTAKGGGMLRFQIGERVMFRKSVNIPEIDMPARAPFQRGINDRLNDYGEAISEAVVGAMEGGK